VKRPLMPARSVPHIVIEVDS